MANTRNRIKRRQRAFRWKFNSWKKINHERKVIVICFSVNRWHIYLLISSPFFAIIIGSRGCIHVNILFSKMFIDMILCTKLFMSMKTLFLEIFIIICKYDIMIFCAWLLGIRLSGGVTGLLKCLCLFGGTVCPELRTVLAHGGGDCKAVSESTRSSCAAPMFSSWFQTAFSWFVPPLVGPLVCST